MWVVFSCLSVSRSTRGQLRERFNGSKLHLMNGFFQNKFPNGRNSFLTVKYLKYPLHIRAIIYIYIFEKPSRTGLFIPSQQWFVSLPYAN